MATYSLDDVMGGGNTYSLDEVLGKPSKAPTRTEKYVRGLVDPLVGIGQMTQKMLPPNIQARATEQMNRMGAPFGVETASGEFDQQVAQGEQAYQDRRTAAGESGVDGYRLLGNVVNPMILAPSAKIPQAATTMGKIATGVGVGGVMGGTQPVTSGDFDKEKAKQVGVGMLGGGAVPLFTGTASRLISPKASVNPNVNTLKSSGVTPTIGQTLGGWANKLEERMQSLPIMGDMISSARKRAGNQFSTATFNKALKPIGKELPDGISGREAINFTETTLRNQYDDVLNKIGSIAPDEQFNSKIASLEKMVNNKLMPKAEKAKFTAALSDVKESMAKGRLTSESFKELESSLGADARKLASSTNIYEGKLAPAVKQLQAELRDMLKRQAGDSADDLQKVNLGWANFKRVQRAAGSVGADDGAFSPAQFQNAVKALDKSKDKGAFSRGAALGQDLGDAGQSVLTGKVPNSGTAERLFYGLGGLATGAWNPAIPATLLGGASLYTPAGQKLLNALVSSRPDLAPTVANAVRNNSQYLLPAGGVAGLSLLNQ